MNAQADVIHRPHDAGPFRRDAGQAREEPFAQTAQPIPIALEALDEILDDQRVGVTGDERLNIRQRLRAVGGMGID